MRSPLKSRNQLLLVRGNTEDLKWLTSIPWIKPKYVYNVLLKKFFVPPPAESKILKRGFTPETVQKVYELPFQIKCDFKITMFQYKIIHNILAKMSLFRARMSDNDVCPQCLADTHFLDHMFLRCSSVIAFWKTFQNWWTNKTKQQLTSDSIALNFSLLM